MYIGSIGYVEYIYINSVSNISNNVLTPRYQCRRPTVIGGLDVTWHSKYTSLPSLICRALTACPYLSLRTGGSEKSFIISAIAKVPFYQLYFLVSRDILFKFNLTTNWQWNDMCFCRSPHSWIFSLTSNAFSLILTGWGELHYTLYSMRAIH